MDLITRPPRTYRVSQDAVSELEDAIARDPRVHVAGSRIGAFSRATYLPWRVIYEIESHLGVHILHPSAARTPWSRENRDQFVVLMGLDHWKCMPTFFSPGRKSAYLFDAWPNNFRRIAEFIRYWGIGRVFVSSSQAAKVLDRLVSGCAFQWIPEGVDPDVYRSLPYEERDIDVLQLGRLYEPYHEVIAPSLARERRSYLFEGTKGTLVFPTRAAFIDGLARSRISICVPSSVTHPERSGGIETLTHRYLQSMASKCLVVGRAPRELIALFGYNPVIEIDMADPVGQLRTLLDGFEEHVGLIERNHAAVLEGHTWRLRWAEMARLLLAR